MLISKLTKGMMVLSRQRKIVAKDCTLEIFKVFRLKMEGDLESLINGQN